MEKFSNILSVLSVLGIIMSYLSIIISAFKKSFGWGFVSLLFAPIGGIIFAFTYYKESKFQLFVLGVSLVFLILAGIFLLSATQ
jgi:hypothetical protein